MTDVTIEQTPEIRMRRIRALAERPAGYAVARKCVEAQRTAEAADPGLRTEHGVRLADEARSWFVGALGEMHVGGLLAALGDEWTVLHAVPIGSGTADVDHLLIGPPGVVTINTKHHRDGSVWVVDSHLRVNNQPTHHIRDATGERDRVQRLLQRADPELALPVTSIVAVHGARSITDKRDAGAVPQVVDTRMLVRRLRGLPAQVSGTELALARLVAEDPDTWHTDPTTIDLDRTMARFERLVADIDAAERAGSRSRRAPTASHATSPRPATAARRPPAARRPARRRRVRWDQLVKGVVLIGLALTAPQWLPGTMQLLTSVLTSATTSAVSP